MKFLITIAFLLQSFAPFCQPNTDIYLFQLSKDGISDPINISNNEGYDNQPSFWPDSKSILYARTITGQTEIARYFISTSKTEIITNTLQGGEYSPTAIPGQDAISAIRLDSTGLQLLYRYDLNGNYTAIHPTLKIGYHVWPSTSTLIAFVLGEPVTLQKINVKTGEATLLRSSVGRSLHNIPGKNSISFVDKSTDPWTISEMNMTTMEVREITKLTSTTEDYAWTTDGMILIGNESQLQKFDPKTGWLPFADMSSFGISGPITRMATSSDGKWLAIVLGK